MKPEFLKYLGKKVKSREQFNGTYIDPQGRFHTCVFVAHLLWFGKTDEHPSDQWLLDVFIEEAGIKTKRHTISVHDMGVTDAELMKGLQ